MKELKEKILTEGVAIGTQIVKVDNFLNHKLDVAFLDRVGKEFHRRFADCEIKWKPAGSQWRVWRPDILDIRLSFMRRKLFQAL